MPDLHFGGLGGIQKVLKYYLVSHPLSDLFWDVSQNIRDDQHT